MSIKLLRSPVKQSGAALIIGLVLLIALTIIGVSVLTTTSLEQRMAGNMSDLNCAFNNAETAGRVLTNAMANTVGPITRVCTALNLNRCVSEDLPQNWWETANAEQWAVISTSIPNLNLSCASTQPQVVIEIMPDLDVNRGHKYFTGIYENIRLTIRGTGRSNNSESIIQQTVIKY